MTNQYYPFFNEPLPYAYDALEPFIDAKTMHLHHDKHLQTYINNLNAVLKENPCLQRLSLEQLTRCNAQLPQEVQTKVRNNAGGVYNHRFYFSMLRPPAPLAPVGPLATAICRQFDGMDAFVAAFKEAALSVFGSGYAWLVFDRGRLRIVTTPNQNTPLEHCCCPLLTIDVWEHAYYLKHYNVRADYINDWLQIINWSRSEGNYRRLVRR